VQDLFRVSCRFECEDDPIIIQNEAATNHLYRIAQEAVHNAIKHGRARNIVIRLTGANGRGTLGIQDDGCGFRDVDAHHPGMGLNIMQYRAGMIGGVLEITAAGQRGTLVRCVFPM
jgi:signal transduction histidine kinase